MHTFTLCLVVGVLACHVGPSLAQPEPEVVFSDRTSLLSFIAPLSQTTLASNIFANGIALDYDLARQKLYASDVSRNVLYEIDLSPPGPPTQTVILNTGLATPDGIAIDYVNQKLYWSDTGRDQIGVIDLATSNTAIIVNTNLDEPRGLALDLRDDQRWLYFTDWGNPPHISRVRPDGSERQTLITGADIPGMRWPNGITIDYAENKLYWVEASGGYLARAELNGAGPTIILQGLSQPFDVVVCNDFVYWTEWGTRSLRRANKDGTNPGVLWFTGRANAGVEVLDPCQNPLGTPVCGNNNGGCSHVCVMWRPCAPRSCVCPAGMVISPPGGTQCVPAPTPPLGVCGPGYEGTFPDCTQCSPGFIQPLQGNGNTCYPCCPGETSVSPFTECVCPAGYEGSPPSCTPCTTGFYQPQVGNGNTCLPCADGETSYRPFTTCVSEQLCPPGTWDVSQGERQHRANAKGKLHATCVECEQGTFSSAVGASDESTCIPCPRETTTIGTGSTSVEDCYFCGSACPTDDHPGQGQGHALAKGKQNKRLGSSPNIPDEDPNGSLTQCNAGEYMEFGTCTLCPPNTYQDVPHGGESCSPCPTGKITAGYGSTSIKDCVAEEKNYDVVIGAVIGSVVIMVLVAAILIICRFRNKRKLVDDKAKDLPQNPLASVQGDAEHTASFSRATTRVGSWNKSFQL